MSVTNLQSITDILHDAWIHVSSGTFQTVFVETNDAEQLGNALYPNLLELTDDKNILGYSVTSASRDPFFPIMSVIQNMAPMKKRNDLNKFIKDAGVFRAFRPMFESYFAEHQISDSSEIFLPEIEYAFEEMCQSVLRLLRTSTQHQPLVILLKNAEYLSPSTLELFKRMIQEQNKQAAVLFVLLFTNKKINSDSNSTDAFQKFLESILTKISIFTIEVAVQKISLPQPKTPAIRLESLVKRLSNVQFRLQFLNLHEAKVDLESIFSDFHQLSESDQEQFPLLRLMLELGNVYAYIHDHDRALFYYQRILDHISHEEDDAMHAMINRKIATIFLQKNSVKDAGRHAELSMKFARKHKDPQLLIRSYFVYLSYLVNDFYISDEMKRNDYFEFVELAKKHKAHEMLSRTINAFIYTRVIDSVDERIKQCLWCIHVAKAEKNKFLLAEYYHNLSILYVRETGDHPLSANYLKKSIHLKKKINNPYTLALVINTLGYNYLTSGRAQEANQSFFQAIRLLESVRNYREISLTMYNVGFNYFMHFEFKEAITYFESTIELMDIMGFESIPFHTLYGMYALIGLSYFKIGNRFKAIYYANRMDQVSKSPCADELMFAALFRAFLAKKREIAENLLAEAETIVMDDLWRPIRPFFYSQAVDLSALYNREDNETDYVQRGLAFSKELKLPFYIDLFTARMHRTVHHYRKINRSSNIHLETFLYQAKQEASHLELQRRANEAKQLHQLQAVFQSKQLTDLELSTALNGFFQANFMIHDVSIAFKKASHWTVEFTTHDVADNQDWIDQNADVIFHVSKLTNGFFEWVDCVYTDQQTRKVLRIALIANQQIFGVILLEGDPTRFQVEASHLDLISQELSALFFNRRLEAEVVSQNKRIQVALAHVKNIMDHADQGFFTFGRALTVLPEYSQKCTEIFGKPIENHLITSLFFEGGSIDARDFAMIWDKVFRDKSQSLLNVYFSMLKDGFKEVRINQKIIQLEFKLISDFGAPHERIVMAVISDVTENRKLQLKLLREERVTNMVVKTAQNRSDVITLIRSFHHFVSDDLPELMESQAPIQLLNEVVCRKLHTFKGLFAQFHFHKMPHFLHDAEQLIMAAFEEMFEHSNVWLNTVKRIDWLHAIREDEADLKKAFGEDFLENDANASVDASKIIQLEQHLIETIGEHYHEHIRQSFRSLRKKPFFSLFESYKNMALELAAQLGKSIVPIVIEGGNRMVEPDAYRGIVQSLVHVFRNCIDHGIEEPSVRMMKGKKAQGFIRFRIDEDNSDFVIQLSDDGQGLDLELMRQKALQRNLVTPHELETWSEQQVIDLIFQNEFSTREEISQLSGRGIGMSAIKAELEKLQGQINVASAWEQGTTFTIRLPIID